MYIVSVCASKDSVLGNVAEGLSDVGSAGASGKGEGGAGGLATPSTLWLEVSKVISFIFHLLVSRGYGNALADVLLYGQVQHGTAEEAHALHGVFHCDCLGALMAERSSASLKLDDDSVGECGAKGGARDDLAGVGTPTVGSVLSRSPSSAAALTNTVSAAPFFPPKGDLLPERVTVLRRTLTFLIDAHGDDNHALPAAQVFRSLLRVPPVVQFMYAFLTPREDAGVVEVPEAGPSSASVDGAKTDFYRTFIGHLCVFLTVPNVVQMGQVWKSLESFLTADHHRASTFLVYYMNDVVNDVLLSAIDAGNCILCYYGLSLLHTILHDGAFGSASAHYAACPALLCSVLQCVGTNTTQVVTRKMLNVLTDIMNVPELSLPIRYILHANKDGVLRLLDYMASLTYAQGTWNNLAFEQDRRNFVFRLNMVLPPSEEEIQALLAMA